jgi:hypothetical protein
MVIVMCTIALKFSDLATLGIYSGHFDTKSNLRMLVSTFPLTVLRCEHPCQWKLT